MPRCAGNSGEDEEKVLNESNFKKKFIQTHSNPSKEGNNAFAYFLNTLLIIVESLLESLNK